MALGEEEAGLILKFVKKEPRTVQEVSKVIGRSWVTTDTYLKQLKDRTGLVSIKTFRKGTQAALKIVFYNYSESVSSDDVNEELFAKIRAGRAKSDFDFLDIYQYAKRKRAVVEHGTESPKGLIAALRSAQESFLSFSGNLSFLNLNGVLEELESALKRKVSVKIICRINFASLRNFISLQKLIQRYPDFIEVRHTYQPLRGSIVDGKWVRFKQAEKASDYKKGELSVDTFIFYEIRDEELVSWLEKVFWSMFRVSMDAGSRMKELKRIG
ncbi:hypothetical protein JW711_01450 [Candidatus Woesearchaeota archaeon]|nr:hypothetical protein [Candidatus Woesearchaeota archaeon]